MTGLQNQFCGKKGKLLCRALPPSLMIVGTELFLNRFLLINSLLTVRGGGIPSCTLKFAYAHKQIFLAGITSTAHPIDGYKGISPSADLSLFHTLSPESTFSSSISNTPMTGQALS